MRGIYSKDDYNRKYNQRLKIETFSHYGIVCSICGLDDIDMLHLDHINDDGYKERKEIGNGVKMYTHLRRLNWPAGYQVLCANHNFKKAALKRRNESWEEWVREYAEKKH